MLDAYNKNNVKFQDSCIVKSNTNCESNPCLNGGTCVIGMNNLEGCICPESFTGKKCIEYNLISITFFKIFFKAQNVK